MHDHVGPLARSVEDCALLMDALVGFDPLDPVSIRDGTLAGFRRRSSRDVARPRASASRARRSSTALDPDIEAAVERRDRAARRNRRAPSRDVELPPVDSFAVLGAEIYEYHAELVADAARRALYQPITLERIMSGGNVSAVDYLERGGA